MGRVLLALEAEWRIARQAPQTLTMRQRTALAGEAYSDWITRHGDDPPPAPVMNCVAAILYDAAAARPAPFLLAADLPARIKAKGIGSVQEASLEAANRDRVVKDRLVQ
jgi:hypothetical protein